MPMRKTLEKALDSHRAGRLAEAEVLYQQVLAEHPEQADALGLLGVLYSQMAQHAKARELIRRAIAVNPRVPHHHTNLGAAFVAEGRYEEAIPAYRQAMKLDPRGIDAHKGLTQALLALGRLDDSIAVLRQIVTLLPDDVESWVRLSAALAAADRLEESIPVLSRIVELQPNRVESLANLGSALQKAGRYDEAINTSRRAIALAPGNADAHLNLGAALMQTGEYDEATVAFGQAIALRSDHAQAHGNLGLLLLLHGNYNEGWREYQWRFKTSGSAPIRSRFTQPHWDGSALAGRRIVLYADQGLGDCIQFLRYVPMVTARGGKVTLAIGPEFKRLAPQSEQIGEAAPQGPTAASDVCCPLSSLPLLLGTTLETIPADIPYLFADGQLTAHWKARLGAGPGLKVGLVWAGNPRHANDRNRSLPAGSLAPLGSLAGITYVSLQKGERAAEAAELAESLHAVDFSSELNDLADTAALIVNLDLVISVDTAVAHLAGAMGKPVWVLLPLCPDWRWMLDRGDSPWYPSMRLFRQRTPGDWLTPIQQVADALREMAE